MHGGAHRLSAVMPALVAGIHVFFHARTWMPATSPAMTPNKWFNMTRTRHAIQKETLNL